MNEVLNRLCLGHWVHWMNYLVAKAAILLCPWALWASTAGTAVRRGYQLVLQGV